MDSEALSSPLIEQTSKTETMENEKSAQWASFEGPELTSWRLACMQEGSERAQSGGG